VALVYFLFIRLPLLRLV